MSARPIVKISVVLAATLVFFLAACNTEPYFPENFAIVYGVSLYYGTTEGAGNNLTYCDDDARAVAELLRDKGYQVIERIDDSATLSNLTADVESVSELIEQDSTFLFYFSGHGFSGSELSLSYTDFPVSNQEPDSGDMFDEWIFLHGSIDSYGLASLEAAVSDDMLDDITSTIPTDRKVIVIDACNSGGFIGNQESVDGFPQNIYTGEKDNLNLFNLVSRYMTFTTTDSADVSARNAIVLAASGELEYSWEYGGYGHGAFTNFLLSAPQNADFNHDGYITVLESYSYIADKIENEWVDVVNGPVFLPRVSGGGVDLVLFAAD